MNSVVKAASKLLLAKNVLNLPLTMGKHGSSIVGNGFSSYCISRTVPSGMSRPFTRSIWSLVSHDRPTFTNRYNSGSFTCSCGCGVHTKGDKELTEFLKEEIEAERKLQKTTNVPSKLDEFEVKLEHSEITLTKKFNDESIEVSLNVTHTVDADAAEPEINPQADKPPDVDMKSKPNFEVDIKKGSRTLSFSCSYVNEGNPAPTEDEFNDIFAIEEVTLFEGEWNDKKYAVAGDILDGYLYDLFMNMLEERGVSNEFAEKLSDLCTTHEHNLYIGMLEDLQKFVAGK